MLKKKLLCISLAMLLAVVASSAGAKMSPEEIARLDKDLTPMGGERAGNADGTIPAWTGGITTPPAGYQPGMHYIDPFPDDKALFTITKDNMNQYADKLSAAQKAMLETYDTFKMNVYQTRRTAAFPERIYEATKKAAATAELVENGYGVKNSAIGTPFPIPKNGLEVIWNHILRYRCVTAARSIAQAVLTRSGDYTLVKMEDSWDMLYAHEGATPETVGNVVAYFKQEVVAPARLAGGILLVHETMNQVVEPRSAWIYNPGQRRVRRAPNVAYDNPGTAADGVRTTDQFDMFSGATDRYDWKLVGKKELYVPYNEYRLHSDKLKYEDILTPLHLNPDVCRYELHRVWVVEATLKEGSRHLYKRRTFYVDEDSWQILLADIYDNRDQLWRYDEGHAMNYYSIPNLWTTLEVHGDLQSGRYLALGLMNESSVPEFDIELSKEDFTPAALRRQGRR